MSVKIIFSKKEVNDIIKRYTIDNEFMSEIARSYNVHYKTIRGVLVENNIEINSIKYKWNKNEIEEIIKLYTKNKKSLYYIGDKYNVSAKAIMRLLERNSIPRRKCTKQMYFSQSEIDDIVERYSGNEIDIESLELIADSYDVSRYKIVDILESNGVSIKSKRSSRIYDINHNYFDEIDIEEKAYWLGFLAADGCVCEGGTITLCLSSKDADHIYKFKNAIGSEHNIVTFSKKTRMGKMREYTRINVSSKQMVNSLNKYNIKPQKVKSVYPPMLFLDFPNAFWRGVFDGDGCLGKFKSGKRNGKQRYSWHLSLAGNEKMLNCFRVYINHICGTQASIKKGRYSYSINVGGKNMVYKISRNLYESSNIYLDRKYNKYLNLKKEVKGGN